MGVNRVANVYGVLPTTLIERIAGWVIHGTNIGCYSNLNVEEEKKLADYLVACSKLGYGKKIS